MEVLDPTVLKNLHEMVGGDVEFLIDLINTFLEDAPRMLADMRQSLESGDAKLLHRSAHSLKSNSAEFGAMTLSELSRELETLSKGGSVEGAEELVGRVETEFAQAKVALEAMRQEL
jgi:HPt (histidine-containing phosphotransfer) domain-containing protein